MKKISGKKNTLSPKAVVGLVIIGLLIMLAVILKINQSQDIGSDAKKNKDQVEVCAKDEMIQINKKGNTVCVKKPKSEINGKTGCKNGENEYTNTDGSKICLAKCKSGYKVQENRETGKLGCFKEIVPGTKCNLQTQKVINGKCVCKPGYVTMSDGVTCAEKLECSANEIYSLVGFSQYCTCRAGYEHLSGYNGCFKKCDPGYERVGSKCVAVTI